jgi:hypothetical protein
VSNLNITATADFQPEIRYAPMQIQLQGGPLPRALTNFISVKANTGAPLKVLDASATVPGVDVAINVLAPNENYAISVGFPQGFEIKPGQKMVVRIKTDNLRYPVIEVPILQPLMRRPLSLAAPAPLSANPPPPPNPPPVTIPQLPPIPQPVAATPKP